jgi:lactoylglutathione lyase
MKGLTDLGHIAIRVKDIDRSLAFYTGKLGFREMFRLNRDNGDLWLLYLRLTDTQYIELFPDAVGDHVPGREAIGLNHFCLCVENIDETLQELEQADVVITQALKTGPDGNRQAWFDDPDGNRIELLEMAADSLQYQALRRFAAE